MQNGVENLISKLAEITNDRTSGSLDLVFAILDAFSVELNFEKSVIDKESAEVIREALRELENNQRFFISVHKIIIEIKQIFDVLSPDLKQLFSFIDSTKQYYNKLPNRQVADFLKYGIEAHKVLVHSNSHSVKQFLLTLRNRGVDIQKVFQTISFPGGEGVLQADFFKKNKFSVEVISDEQVKEFVSKIDVAFFGADLICQHCFINKVKTNDYCEKLHIAGVPVFVLADKNKCVSSQNDNPYKVGLSEVFNSDGNQLFEEIQNEFADGFLIPDE